MRKTVYSTIIETVNVDTKEFNTVKMPNKIKQREIKKLVPEGQKVINVNFEKRVIDIPDSVINKIVELMEQGKNDTEILNGLCKC